MPLDITNHFLVSLAYKAAVIQGMLGEGNFAAHRLALHEPVPIQATHINANVNPPLRGGLGSFETESYFYGFPGKGDVLFVTNSDGTMLSFPERGKLAYIENKKPFVKYGGSFLDAQETLAKLPCLIDTNGAYRLATQWLAAIAVDVRSLEARHKPMVAQQAYCDPPLTPEVALELARQGKSRPPPGHKMVILPIFDVTWGGTTDQSPPVWVQVFGVTREPLRIRMEDTSFSRRPPIVITNALELNRRPDPVGKTLQSVPPRHK